MQQLTRKQFIFIWLLIGSLAAAVCSLIWPAAHIGEELIPVGNDSFYHARRILDTASNPSAYYEFDAHIHAPEGSLLTWPWGYDYVMGSLVRLGAHMGFSNNPMAVLIWIPVLAVFISMGLILRIASRLNLPLWASALAGLCVALSPLTQYIHGVGFVDHHFAEYIFVLTMVASGWAWLADPSNSKRAMLAGLVLGVAPAVHNALFVLQIPILLAVFVLWIQGIRLPSRSTGSFCAALIGATLLILFPSLPFRLGKTEYYLLSWFHLYVASGTAITCCFFSLRLPTARNLAAFVTLGIVLLIPLSYQIASAGDFLAGKLLRLDSISEMLSLRQYVHLYGPFDLSNRYSGFIWLLPATYAYCIYKAWSKRSSPEILFWLSAVFGLSLLSMQFRLHYFGSFALYLPWLVAARDAAANWPTHAKKIALGTAFASLLMYAPPMRNQLLGPMMPANDEYFLAVRPVLLSLADACQRDPGVVLADNDAGHYIRYYTQCSVLSNNFLLTEQHAVKILQMESLFELNAAELPAAAPFVKYVLVRPMSIVQTDQGPRYMSYSTRTSELVGDLLLRPNATPAAAVPSNYELLHEARIRVGDESLTYARLYRLGSKSPTQSVAH